MGLSEQGKGNLSPSHGSIALMWQDSNHGRLARGLSDGTRVKIQGLRFFNKETRSRGGNVGATLLGGAGMTPLTR